MMGYRNKVRALADLPETPDEISDRLSTLCDAFYTVREAEEKAGNNVDRLNRDYTAICDLHTHLDLARGERTLTEKRADSGTETDPFTQLDAAASYGVMAKDKAKALQAEFHAAAERAAGCKLTRKQVKALHGLMTNYNPFGVK